MARRTRSILRPPMASPWARTRSGSPSAPMAGRRMPSSSCLTGSWQHFDAGIGARGAEARRRWEALFADYREQFPELATEIDQMQRRELPAGMGPQPAELQGGSQGHRRTRCFGRGAERARPEHSLVSRRLGRSRPIEQDDAEIRRRRRLRARHARAAAICISASASTRWRRSSTACRCRSCGRSGRHFSSSATMLGRPFGCPR